MEEINLQTQNDLLKYSFTKLKNTNLNNFKGTYFDKIFAEAMRLEKQEKDEIIVREIEFEMCCHVDYSQRIVLCGNKTVLGDWNAKKSFPLTWTTGDFWNGKVKFLTNFDFKFAVLEKEQIKRWESSGNRMFDFNAIKEKLISSRSCKNVVIDNNMRVSYDFTSKVLTLHCVWK